MTGVALSATVEPLPSWPALLPPHVHADPSAARATAWIPPAEIEVAEIWNHRDDLGLAQQLGAPVYAGAPPQDD